MTLLRGYADDMELMPWLREKIWPLEARLTAEDVRWGVKLGCLELIRIGITCYSDMYYFPDETAQATREMGLRAFISGVVFDMQPQLLQEVEPFIRRWKGDELITPAVGPHAAYTCSEETLLKAKEIADRHSAMIHIHLSETREEVDGFLLSKGKSPVEYLDSSGNGERAPGSRPLRLALGRGLPPSGREEGQCGELHGKQPEAGLRNCPAEHSDEGGRERMSRHGRSFEQQQPQPL